MIGGLPDSLVVGDREYPIRTDYRDVLQLFEMYSDMELDAECKCILSVFLIFKEFESTDSVYDAVNDGFNLQEALDQISWFVSAGNNREKKEELPTYDWVQDEQMIFSAVNKVAGKETRTVDYMHWWTFLGFFNEVGEGTFSYIVNIRYKLNHGKKLESYEREFYQRNKDVVRIKPKLTAEEQAEEDEYQAMLKEVLG